MSDSVEVSRALNILDVLKATIRHWLLIPALLAAGIAAGFAIISVAEVTYQTTAKVLLERRDVPYKSGEDASKEAAVVIDERYVDGQVAVISSESFAKAVADKLQIAEKLKAPKAPGLLKQLLIGWGFADDKSKLTNEQRAMAQVMEDVTVFATPTANVISIRVTGPEAQGSADLANGLAEHYVASVTGDDAPAQTRVRAWLSDQIAELRKKVAESEGAAERFRSNAGLLKGTNSTLGTEQISAINAQLSTAEAAEAEAVTKASAIKALLNQTGSVDAAPEVAGSTVIQQLQQQRIAASRVVTELSATYLGNHPKLIAARQQVAEIDKQVRREALKVVEGLRSQADLAAARTKSLRAKLNELKQTESTANLEDVQLKALEREATANRQLLETLLARYVEINTRQDLDVKPTSARIIQSADVPSFVHYPRKGPILLLTSLAGLTLGLGLAFFYEIARAAGSETETATRKSPSRRSRAADDGLDDRRPVAPKPAVSLPPISSVADVPVSQAAPEAVRAAEIVKSQSISAAAIEQYPLRQHPNQQGSGSNSESNASMADELLRFRKQGSAANVAFARVGCGPRESALAVASAARDLAKSGYRCLVIDLDMERAELERLFELPEGPGLLDLLAGQSDFNRLISRDTSSTAQIIRLGDPANAPGGDVLAARLKSILKSLQGIYDYILLHAGASSGRALQIVQLADVAVFVSPPDHDAETISAMQQLRESSTIEVINLSVESYRTDHELVS